MHAVGAVGAEEFQPQLHPADMRLDLARHLLRLAQLRHVEREVDWIAHGIGSVLVAGGGGATASAGRAAALFRAAVSRWLIRRLSRQRVPR